MIIETLFPHEPMEPGQTLSFIAKKLAERVTDLYGDGNGQQRPDCFKECDRDVRTIRRAEVHELRQRTVPGEWRDR